MADAYLNSEWDALEATHSPRLRVVNMGPARFPSHKMARWSGRLPQAQCTLLAGEGGIGKTTLTAMIAACLSNGEPLPGEEAGEEPTSTLVLTFEDNFEAFWLPRFRAYGGNPDMLNKIDLDEVFKVEHIAELKEHTGHGLIILDPVSEVAANSGLDANRAETAKAIMGGMRDVAFATGASALCVAHFGKATDRTLKSMVSGSAQWVQASRSLLVFGQLVDGTLGLLHEKANASRLQFPLEFKMDETMAELHGDIMPTAALRYKSLNPDITHFYQRIANPNEDDGSTKKHVYAKWIMDKLGRTTQQKAKAIELESLFLLEHKGINPLCFQAGVACAKDPPVAAVYAYVDQGHMMLSLRRPQGAVLTNEHGDVL